MTDYLVEIRKLAAEHPNMRLCKAVEKIESIRVRDELVSLMRETKVKLDASSRIARNLRAIADRMEGKI